MLLRPMLNDLWNLLNNLLKQQLLNVRRNCLKLQEICSKVPYEPASTFAEAVQSVWFIQCILQIESNGHSLSYGRFDQYMYPYVKADLESGRETEESIVERLTTFGLRLLQLTKYVVKHIPSHLQVVRFIKTLRLVVKRVIRKMPSTHCLIWC